MIEIKLGRNDGVTKDEEGVTHHALDSSDEQLDTRRPQTHKKSKLPPWRWRPEGNDPTLT